MTQNNENSSVTTDSSSSVVIVSFSDEARVLSGDDEGEVTTGEEESLERERLILEEVGPHEKISDESDSEEATQNIVSEEKVSSENDTPAETDTPAEEGTASENDTPAEKDDVSLPVTSKMPHTETDTSVPSKHPVSDFLVTELQSPLLCATIKAFLEEVNQLKQAVLEKNNNESRITERLLEAVHTSNVNFTSGVGSPRAVSHTCANQILTRNSGLDSYAFFRIKYRPSRTVSLFKGLFERFMERYGYDFPPDILTHIALSKFSHAHRDYILSQDVSSYHDVFQYAEDFEDFIR